MVFTVACPRTNRTEQVHNELHPGIVNVQARLYYSCVSAPSSVDDIERILLLTSTFLNQTD